MQVDTSPVYSFTLLVCQVMCIAMVAVIILVLIVLERAGCNDILVNGELVNLRPSGNAYAAAYLYSSLQQGVA